VSKESPGQSGAFSLSGALGALACHNTRVPLVNLSQDCRPRIGLGCEWRGHHGLVLREVATLFKGLTYLATHSSHSTPSISVIEHCGRAPCTASATTTTSRKPVRRRIVSLLPPSDRLDLSLGVSKAKTRIKFTFNEVLIQRMPRRFKSPCAAQTELGQEKLLVATASATGDDEVPPSFLRRFTGLNACPGDLVPSKALRSDRFRQRLKLSG